MAAEPGNKKGWYLQPGEELPAATELAATMIQIQAEFDALRRQPRMTPAKVSAAVRTDLKNSESVFMDELKVAKSSLGGMVRRLDSGVAASDAAVKAEFRGDQRFNILAKKHKAAKAAHDRNDELGLAASNFKAHIAQENAALQATGHAIQTRLLPVLVMRTGEPELLDGDPAQVVRSVIGNYQGMAFGAAAMGEKYKREEVMNFATAANQLQLQARQLGCDAIVGVRWLQCDEFEIEKDDKQIRRVHRHKCYEAMLCGTAVKTSAASHVQGMRGAAADPFQGPLFDSTLREPPFGTTISESLGIVQGVGAKLGYNNWSSSSRAMGEAEALREAHAGLLAAARALGAHAVLGVKPEEPHERMCILRGSAVRLNGHADPSQPLARIDGFVPPSSLQLPPANLHVIEVKGLVSSIGIRPQGFWNFDNPAGIEEQSFGSALQGLQASAQQVGANAVLGVKWMHDNDRFISTVVGTAVVLGTLPVPTPHWELAPQLVAFASTLREPPYGFRVAQNIGLAVSAFMSPCRTGWFGQQNAQGELAATTAGVQKMELMAARMGAHAILGVKIEALTVYNCSRFMFVVKGTAVRLAQHLDAADAPAFHHDRLEVTHMQVPAAHLCVSTVLGLVSAVGYRQWRIAFGPRGQRLQDYQNEISTFAAAVQGLVQQAKAKGANGVMGIKWQHDDDHRCSCLVATAVVLARKPDTPAPASLGSGRPKFISTSRDPPAGFAVAHTVSICCGAGMTSSIWAFGAGDRANQDSEAYDNAMASLRAQAEQINCCAILGVKLESPEPGLVILRGTAVQLTQLQCAAAPDAAAAASAPAFAPACRVVAVSAPAAEPSDDPAAKPIQDQTADGAALRAPFVEDSAPSAPPL